MDHAAPTPAAQVAALWRYPVKSFQGEELTEAVVDQAGLAGDRCWGLRDETTGRILTGRREPRLLLAAASLTDDGAPAVTLPDGTQLRGTGPHTDAALSDWLGRPVSLVAAAGTAGGRAEYFADATDDASAAIEWTMPLGRFVDNMPLLVLTTASLRAAAALHPDGDWHARRFRPNVLLDAATGTESTDGWIEDGWCGDTLRVGSAELAPRQPCIRCTMVTRPQPGLERDLDIFKTLSRHHGSTFGVWTQVRTSGTLHVGDAVAVVS